MAVNINKYSYKLGNNERNFNYNPLIKSYNGISSNKLTFPNTYNENYHLPYINKTPIKNIVENFNKTGDNVNINNKKSSKLNFSTSLKESMPLEYLDKEIKLNPFDSDLDYNAYDHIRSKNRHLNNNDFMYTVKDNYGRKIKTDIFADENNVITENSENWDMSKQNKLISDNDNNDYLEYKDKPKKKDNIIEHYSNGGDKSTENYNFNNNEGYLNLRNDLKSNNLNIKSYNGDINDKNSKYNGTLNFYNNINSNDKYNVNLHNLNIKNFDNYNTKSMKLNKMIKTPIIAPISTEASDNSELIISNSYGNNEINYNLKRKHEKKVLESIQNEIMLKERKKKFNKINNDIENLKIEIKTIYDQNEMSRSHLNKLKKTDEKYNVFFENMAINMERLKRYRMWLNDLQKKRKRDFAIFDDNIASFITKIRISANENNYDVLKNLILLKNEEMNSTYFVDEIKRQVEKIRHEYSLMKSNRIAERICVYDMYGDQQYKIKCGLEADQNSKKNVYDTSNFDDFYKVFSKKEEFNKELKYSDNIYDSINKDDLIFDKKLSNPELLYLVKNHNKESNNLNKNLLFNQEISEEELRRKINNSLAIKDRYSIYDK